MTKLSWDAVGSRYYEIGVDRGVFYLPGENGVAWNGLMAVAETKDGGEPLELFYDGNKYRNLLLAETFAAKITALTPPNEFRPCLGIASVQNGLFATQQSRKSFDFTYRTLIGNDVDASDHSYKIHLVYNALAVDSDKTYQSLGAQPTATIYSWDISSLPPVLAGRKPTAHFVVEASETDPALLTTLEDMLYGSAIEDPSMPTAAELITLFTT